MTQIWGHRGTSAAPENTLPAFELALAQGAEGVELDVHLTRDDALVVIHDETLERTTDGNGWVADRSLAELRTLDAAAGRPDYAGTRIPLLAEVLELLRPTDAVANVELKTDRLPYPGIEQRVLEVVHASGMDDRVRLSSFNHYTLRNLRSLGAEQPLGALLTDRLFKPWRYASWLDVDAIHPSVNHCTAALVSRSHARGLAVCVWTANAERDIRRLLSLGVDAIMTDVPALALALRDESPLAAR